MYFIAYHKAHENGPYWLYEDGTCVFDSKKRSLLERAIGETVTVIQGWRPKNSAPTLYALVRMFVPEGEVVDLGDDWFRIEGKATRLYPIPTVLNEFDWFRRLLEQQRNFSLGFNALTDPEIVAELNKIPYQEPSILFDEPHSFALRKSE